MPHPFKTVQPPAPALNAPAAPALEGWFIEPKNAPREHPFGRIWLNALRHADCLPFAADPAAGIWFPPVMSDRALEQCANRFYTQGFRHALCRNPGQFAPLRRMGYTVHADFSLNIANSRAMEALAEIAADVTLSFELTLRQIRQCPKPIPAGIIVYGRLPLMHTKNCIIRNCGPCRNGAGMALTDRTGRSFPVLCDHECRNTLYNSTPLYLADRARDWRACGVWFGRMLFTDETPERIAALIEEYLHGSRGTPESYTRGLYYRGVY